VSAFPYPSTAAQKVVVGQDIAVRPLEPSMSEGADQDTPLYLTTLPTSTLKQNEAVGQETEDRKLPTNVGVDQELPLYVTTAPS
jgi:hypothetical protein